MDNYIYCAIDKNNNIVEVRGSSRRTTYFKSDKYLKGSVENHNKYYADDPWRVVRFKLVEAPEVVPCSCYHTTIKKEPRYNTITGQIDHYEDIEYGVCWGTKEQELCDCKGNKKNCDFYEHNRIGE